MTPVSTIEVLQFLLGFDCFVDFVVVFLVGWQCHFDHWRSQTANAHSWCRPNVIRSKHMGTRSCVANPCKLCLWNSKLPKKTYLPLLTLWNDDDSDDSAESRMKREHTAENCVFRVFSTIISIGLPGLPLFEQILILKQSYNSSGPRHALDIPRVFGGGQIIGSITMTTHAQPLRWMRNAAWRRVRNEKVNDINLTETSKIEVQRFTLKRTTHTPWVHLSAMFCLQTYPYKSFWLIGWILPGEYFAAYFGQEGWREAWLFHPGSTWKTRWELTSGRCVCTSKHVWRIVIDSVFRLGIERTTQKVNS